MEWVETTGRTIEDAKEAALDELGVDVSDAEFEVLEEPRIGLFGRVRTEGRVKARVRPVAPRAKDDRRRRNRPGSKKDAGGGDAPNEQETGDGRAPSSRGRGARGGGRTRSATDAAGPGASDPDSSSPADSAPSVAGDAEQGRPADDEGGRRPPAVRSGGLGRPQRPPAERGRPQAGTTRQADRRSTRGEGNDVEVALEEQGQVAEHFLRGLMEEFGVSAAIATAQPDDDTLDVSLEGEDLGLLIGPKGTTLLALQDLTRTVVQRRTGASNGRIHVDVSGYRQKRSEALGRFARQVADDVKSSGVRKALEPMSAPDRKVVHDALTDVEGVSTISEGEDERRRVVIQPESTR